MVSPEEMFDLCYAYGGRLDIKNTEQLTPLTLAASLAYKDMYDHVLKKEVQLFWIYSNVAATGYPLEHIDTISPDKGHTNSKSALNLIVYGARLTFEVCVLAGALMYVFLAVVEILYQGLSKFFTKLVSVAQLV
nr:hypothetical protein BaRGS_030934 [Batillaria attramentaria]